MSYVYKRQPGYNFDGEPKMIMGLNGVTFEFNGGQPVMDAGEENWVTICLGTKPGWWGNNLLEKQYQIGDSDFDTTSKGPITRTMLIDSEKEAVQACQSLVDHGVSSRIEAVVNPRSGGNGIDFKLLVHKPEGNDELFIYQRNGLNWIRQITDPASARISNDY